MKIPNRLTVRVREKGLDEDLARVCWYSLDEEVNTKLSVQHLYLVLDG
jgi:hypothetical protein